MKRWFCLLCIITFLLPVLGCSGKKIEYQNPVKVYYCRNDVSYNSEDGVLYPEIRDIFGYENKLRAFLNQYLRGPVDDALYAPFPSNGWVLDITQKSDSVQVILSSHFSLLSGRDLTLSYACISKTIMELTDCQLVYLYLDGTQNNEGSAVIMSKDKILLIDTAKTN